MTKFLATRGGAITPGPMNGHSRLTTIMVQILTNTVPHMTSVSRLLPLIKVFKVNGEQSGVRHRTMELIPTWEVRIQKNAYLLQFPRGLHKRRYPALLLWINLLVFIEFVTMSEFSYNVPPNACSHTFKYMIICGRRQGHNRELLGLLTLNLSVSSSPVK